MIRKLGIFFALGVALLALPRSGFSQCSNTAYGGFTCVQTAEAHSTSATSETATTSANVTSGDAIIGIAASANATLSISATGAGCTNSFTADTVITSGSFQVTQFRSTASSTGACSVKASTSGSAGIMEIRIWEWSGWNGTFDKIGTTATDGYVSSGTSMNCPSVVTTVNGDLVLCHMLNGSAGGNTFTAGANFAIVSQDTTYGKAEEEDVQATYGSITPAFKASGSSYYASGTMALELGMSTAATPTFGLAAGTYTTSLPRTTTITSGTSGVTICYTTNGNTPTASTAGTCNSGSGISSLTNGGSITLAVGTATVQAIATESGYYNSAVGSAAYTITPTLASWSGVTVGPTAGNISSMNGTWIDPASGLVKSWNTLASPITAIAVDAFIDFHGGTNGNAPTTTTLGNSIYGEAGDYTFVTSNAGAGLIYSTAGYLGPLPRPVNVGGTVYTGAGTLGLQCTTGTSVHCGLDQVYFSNAGTSTSLGFSLESNCPIIAFTDCAANGGLASQLGGDYDVIHLSSTVSGYPGLISSETYGGVQSSQTLTYTPGKLYRVNIQLNEGSTGGGATDQMVLCDSNNSFLKYFSVTGEAAAEVPNMILMGISGEEQDVAGINYWYYGYVLSLSGKFSTTSCIL